METKNLGFNSKLIHGGGFKDIYGGVNVPIFQSSTFRFESAEEGARCFNGESSGYIYTRLGNPTINVLENIVADLEKGFGGIGTSSGMGAVNTVYMGLLSKGDHIISSDAVYGPSRVVMEEHYSRFGIESTYVTTSDTGNIKKAIKPNTKVLYLETPANPTNDLIDIAMCANIAKRFSTPEKKVLVTVDNTYMGPIWQHPLKHGADLVCYSATKYIGGHSDVIAGAVLGSKELIGQVKTLRTFFGNMIAPFTGWLLLRSLETLKLRMTQQSKNARRVAEFLAAHPLVTKVYYPGFFSETNHPEQFDIFQRQCEGSGAMLSFDIAGGEAEAFTFLNHLKLIKLAVSLGGTESLAEHPYTMTHADVPDQEKVALGLTESMVRLSIGVENYKDLVWDIGQAFEAVYQKQEMAETDLGFRI